MSNGITRTFRRVAFTALGLGIIATAGPTLNEAAHNEDQQDIVDAAIHKIVQEPFFTCDPAAAGALKNDRAEQLTVIMQRATNDALPLWNRLPDIWLSGVKRMTNTMPGTVKVLEKIVGDVLPDDYHKGSYQTELDNISANLQDLAKRGLGICFDKDLSSLKLGSLSGRGMIILNPAVPEKALAEHLKRHLAKLDQEIVQTHSRLITHAEDVREDWDAVTRQLEAYLQTRKGAMWGLGMEDNPKTAELQEIKAGAYKMTFKAGLSETLPATQADTAKAAKPAGDGAAAETTKAEITKAKPKPKPKKQQRQQPKV